MTCVLFNLYYLIYFICFSLEIRETIASIYPGTWTKAEKKGQRCKEVVWGALFKDKARTEQQVSRSKFPPLNLCRELGMSINPPPMHRAEEKTCNERGQRNRGATSGCKMMTSDTWATCWFTTQGWENSNVEMRENGIFRVLPQVWWMDGISTVTMQWASHGNIHKVQHNGGIILLSEMNFNLIHQHFKRLIIPREYRLVDPFQVHTSIYLFRLGSHTVSTHADRLCISLLAPFCPRISKPFTNGT